MKAKRMVRPAALLAVACTQLAGCAAIEGIFKAGVWVGIIAVVLCGGAIFGLTRITRG